MTSRQTSFLTLISLLGMMLASCELLIPDLPADEETLDGPVAGLSTAEHARFLAGDLAFNNEIFTVQNGLGPIFVATSCGSCHPGDGKGHPFTTLTRFGQADASGNTAIHQGGPQLQNRAIPGYLPESLPAGIPFSRFTPPANTGLGFLAALTDAQILSHADPDDVDGDGISGVPNYIDAPVYFTPSDHHENIDGKYIGRFGKKAGAIDLLQQTANAYNQDIGITSTFNPVDPYHGLVTDPEISDQTILDVVFYLRTLKAPVPRKQQEEDVIRGREIFSTINCASCHIPEWTTPPSDISALSNRTFYPYTDLLMHDMGPLLDDGYTEGTAGTAEWKTPALWGLGLSTYSQGGTYYLMHDGRARSMEAAILLHGGEAEKSKEGFVQLTAAEQQQLVRFLESL